MISLAEGLKKFLEEYFVEGRKQDSEATIRPILVGPPESTLEALFNSLTANGTVDWEITDASQQLKVVVLLIPANRISSNGTSNNQVLSRRCYWDYAVTVRNSRPLVLMLASSTAWDIRPESLANTTETLGTPSVGRGRFRDNTWKNLIQQVSLGKGLDEGAIRSALQEATRQAESLELSIRDRTPWIVMNALMGPTPAGVLGNDIINAAAGFCSGAPGGSPVKAAAQAVKALGSFFGKHGIAEAVDKLKSTNVSQTRALGVDIDGLADHLSARVLTATDFESAPAWQYRPGDPVPTWWHTLDVATVQSLLDEAEDRPTVSLMLSCENALNSADKLPGEPFIVAQTVQLRASAPGVAILTGANFSRKLQRSPAVNLPTSPTDPNQCIDTAPVQHSKPLKYMVTAPNANTAAVDVLALDMFECRGMLHVRDAAKNPPPAFSTASKIWSQHIVLRRGGPFEGRIYHAATVANVRVQPEGEQPKEQPTVANSPFVSVTLDLENNTAIEFFLLDAQGASVARWKADFTVQEITDVARSRFEALIQEHRTGRKTVPRPEDTPLQRAESTSYLACPDSWKAVLACWSSEPRWLNIDWAVATVGDVMPQLDPRPAISPPATLLLARENVRKHLAGKQQTISEIEFNDPVVASLVEAYLAAYIEWLVQAPEHATWLDTIIIHSAAWNAQAGRYIPSDEPVVVLLSPLHPLRLGWHCIAQRQLLDGLVRKCPAAGLLDPSGVPDAGAWTFNTGQGTSPRAFLSIPCKNPHWAVLINHLFLSQDDERIAVLRQISALGLDVQSVAGGFTVSQAIDSLQEVARLLPARATLRIGLVGTSESSAACADGVIEWCESAHHEDEEQEAKPFFVDVFDTRESFDPSPEQLASLSETTEERVKWFKLSQNAPSPRLDLTIIDQLGTYSPTMTGGDARSPIGDGALYRVRVRQDFQNAKTLSESRIARETSAATNFAGRLREAVQKFEASALKDNGASQFRFRPNQDAIGNRLSNSTFLAVTSSQIDPACIVRGVSGQSSYLWDYELPGILGGPDSNVGYYLLAKPLEAMRAAVKRSAALIVSSPPDPIELLDEISRHGIPILKRLASGGTQSRGELGLLLAVRLLQDVFRGDAATARLPVWKDRCIHLILPVDPYEEPFERIRRELCKSITTAQRPDLLVIAIYRPPNGPTSLKITPVEVKFREGNLPSTDARAALRQAENLGKIGDSLWVQPPASDLWATCGRALFAQALDFAFRIYADPAVHGHTNDEWSRAHQEILQEVLEGKTSITVNQAGRLLAFDNSATTTVIDLDGDQLNDTAILSHADARVLLSGSGTLSSQADSSVKLLDFSFPWCADQQPRTQENADVALQVTVSSQPAATIESIADAHPPSKQPEKEIQQAPVTESQRTETPLSPITIPPALRQRVREAFSGFIGNEPALARLTNDLLRALIDRPPHLSKNYLFTGLPSTGKTELSRRIAIALNLPFVKLDGRGVVSRERLFELVNGELNQQNMAPSQVGQQVGLPVMEYPPLIVFIDEVHLVPKALQEALLTMLEAADRTVVLARQVAHVQKATFLFATTRVSDVDPAFVSRCDEIQLREYSEEEVAEILAHKIPHDWPKDIYLQLARLGRCVPRVAMQLANGLETAVLVAEHPKELSAHLDDVRRAREIDEKGLTPMDFGYLDLLERSNRPIGEQVVLNMLRTVDKERILNEIEPFLARLGFIKHGPQGREITGSGKQYVLDKRRTGER